MQTTTRPTVHRATEKDAATVLQVVDALRAVGVAPAGVPGDAVALRALLADPRVVLTCALLDGQPAGMAVLERQGDGRAQVTSICVAPAARRQGIGASLLTNALFALLPIPALYMLLPADDQDALHWASRRGFRELPGDPYSAGQLVELELRLDAPAHGCGCGSGGCGQDGCGGGCSH